MLSGGVIVGMDSDWGRVFYGCASAYGRPSLCKCLAQRGSSRFIVRSHRDLAVRAIPANRAMKPQKRPKTTFPCGLSWKGVKQN